MDEQRKRIYSFRQRLLDGSPPKDAILEMIDDQIREAVDRFLADDYGAASFAEWVGQRLGVELTRQGLQGASTSRTPRRRPGTRPRPQLTETVREAVEENLPADAEPVRVDLAVAGRLGQRPVTA